MPIPDDSFQAVDENEVPMYGTPAIILAGFEPDQQDMIRWVLHQLEMSGIPLTVLARGDGDSTLEVLTQRPDGTNMGTELKLPQTIIVSGLTGLQLQSFMGAYRELPLPRPMWASLTPTSEKWTAKMLLAELVEENRQMQKESVESVERRGR